MLRYANPKRFLDLSATLLPFLWVAALGLTGWGLYQALFVVPPDYQQGDTVRIMYVHVPSAWMASFIYGFMFIASVVGLVWKHPLADTAAKEAAPIGACFTLACLVTGSLWGKPMWGTYWIWDARLTSMLVLFFLYLGYLGVWAAIEDRVKAARANADKIREQKFLLQEGIGLQVKDVFVGLDATKKSYHATLDAMKAATENRDLNTRAYQNELVETEKVIRAQLTEAFMSAIHYKTRYDYVVLQSKLNLVVGNEVWKKLEAKP